MINKKTFLCASLIFMVSIFMNGCSSDTSRTEIATTTATTSTSTVIATDENIQDLTTVPITTIDVQAPTETPPAPSSDPETEAAKKRVEEIINTSKYSVSLVSDSFMVDDVDYYVFAVTYHMNTIEPLVLVNKTNGSLYCISSDNKISSITEHDCYIAPVIEKVSFSGNYILEDTSGTPIASISINDSTTSSDKFNFTAYNYANTTVSNISGEATISSSYNYATFIGENDVNFSFSIEDNILTVSTTSSSEEAQAFIGNYSTTDAASISGKITSSKALETLLSISEERSGMSAPYKENYYFYISDENALVQNHLCFIINAYTSTENVLTLFRQYYVTTDGILVYYKSNSTYTQIYAKYDNNENNNVSNNDNNNVGGNDEEEQ